VRANYTAPNGRWWAGIYVHAAAAQGRLPTLDLDDRRTGAGRSRTSIRTFFLNGATARGWGHQFLVDFENLTDRNYRGVSWGVDAPGRGASLRYLSRF
jgi:hypothetical protein